MQKIILFPGVGDEADRNGPSESNSIVNMLISVTAKVVKTKTSAPMLKFR